MFVFFFSSRRRHTRWPRDWSSDVCSSDLNSSALARFEEKAMEYQIKECARLHLNHITGSGDPFERGSARPLDFGHWAAHKLEDLTDYSIRHGEAVAIGIALDSTYSYLIDLIFEEELNRILQLFLNQI